MKTPLETRYSYQIALPAEKPAAFKGRLTAKPSGKFWIPMPKARLRAFSKVAFSDFPIAPNPTPTARPSGMLWTKIKTNFQWSLFWYQITQYL